MTVSEHSFCIVSRNPTLEQDHLVKLLQQLLLQNRVLLGGLELPHARLPTVADVPTLLGTGNFSLIDCKHFKFPSPIHDQVAVDHISLGLW